MTNRTLPPQPVESNYENSNESEDEDDDIEFDSDESDENFGVEDKARFHSYDEQQFLKLFLLLDAEQGSEGLSFQWKIYAIECQLACSRLRDSRVRGD